MWYSLTIRGRDGKARKMLAYAQSEDAAWNKAYRALCAGESIEEITTA